MFTELATWMLALDTTSPDAVDPINIGALQKLVLQIAGLGIAAGGLMLAFKGMTRHFAEAITGLIGFIVGLAIIGVGFFSESGLKKLATGLANLIFTS